jgi:hypothetical protein
LQCTAWAQLSQRLNSHILACYIPQSTLLFQLHSVSFIFLLFFFPSIFFQ